MANKRSNKPKGLDKQALKDFRSKVAKLKKKGIVSAKVDARSQKATKYMLAKVRKYSDVLSGESIAVKATKEVRQKYTEAGIFKERGSFLIVPKEHEKSRAKIKKGRDMVEITTPLKFGEEREVVLPFKATNMMELAQRISEDPNFDDLKKSDEQFAFRLFGHNSRKAFVDAEEFADHVLRNYQHLFKDTKGRPAIRHLSVIRFKGYADAIPESQEPRFYDKPKRMDASGRNSGRLGTYERQRNAVRAAKKRKARERETPEARAKRLEKQRAYDSSEKRKKSRTAYDAKRKGPRDEK